MEWSPTPGHKQRKKTPQRRSLLEVGTPSESRKVWKSEFHADINPEGPIYGCIVSYLHPTSNHQNWRYLNLSVSWILLASDQHCKPWHEPWSPDWFIVRDPYICPFQSPYKWVAYSYKQPTRVLNTAHQKLGAQSCERQWKCISLFKERITKVVTSRILQ